MRCWSTAEERRTEEDQEGCRGRDGSSSQPASVFLITTSGGRFPALPSTWNTHTQLLKEWIQTFTGEQEALTIKKQILKLANCYDLVYKWVLSAGLYFLPPNVSESKQQKQKCRITSVVTPSATNIHRRGNVSKFYSRDILSHLPTSLLTLWSSASNQSWISLGFNF